MTIKPWSPETNLIIPASDRRANKLIDVSAHIKRMQGLDYIPWSVAQDLLMSYDEALDVGFEEDENGQPFFIVQNVGVYLKPFLFSRVSGNRTPASIYAVRDNKRKATADVTLDTITNQMQRAYAKTIAKETGLAWGLYSKYDESLEDAEPAKEVPAAPERNQPRANVNFKASTVTPPPGNKKVEVDALDF